MGAPYDNIPGVDSTNFFHPDLRAAMATYPELIAAFAAKIHTHKYSDIPVIELGTEDLNTITTQGLYTQSQNVDAITNYPAPVAGLLVVTAQPLYNGFIYQEYFTYTNRKFWRQKYSTTWSSWVEAQPLLSGGDATKFLRGDQSWQTLNKAAVGLGNVDNTSDATKLADYIPKWKPTTVYTLGQQVISPNNAVVTANVAHTSAATYDQTKWNMGLSLPFGHMGRTAGFQALSGLTAIGMDAAQTLNGGMTFDNAGDKLVVPIAGWYDINCQAYFSGSTTPDDIGIVAQSGSNNRQIIRVSLYPIGSDTTAHGKTRVYAAAGDGFQLQQQSGGQQAWGSNGQNGSWLEVAFVSST